MVQVKKMSTKGAEDDDKPIPGLNTATAIALFLIVTTAAPLSLVEASSWPNALGLSILVFNNINILIACCEIILGRHIDLIKKDYLMLKKEYDGKYGQALFAYLFMPLSLKGAFDGRKWSRMWSTYSLYDPSYQNQESFGFFIDVGNGWSTIPPCLLWNVAILFPNVLTTATKDAYLWVGILGCCSYWQILYGTIIYFLSYLFNKRYSGFSIAQVVGFVVVANGIWFVCSIIALYACVLVLKDQSLGCLR